MNLTIHHRIAVSVFVVLCVSSPLLAAEKDQILAPPSFDDARQRVVDWAATQGELDGELKRELGQLWAEPAEPLTTAELLEQTVRTFGLVDAETGRFVRQLDPLSPPLSVPDISALTKGDSDFFRSNLSLYLGQFLARGRMYDEALAALQDVSVEEAVDPAACLFYTAVCQHQLLQKIEGLQTIDRLLNNTEDVPTRFSSVAELIKYDLEQLEDRSLGEVAHIMSDVERRLWLGRGGKRVQEQGDEIIDRLDEMIKKMEDQQNSNSSSGGSGAGNQNQSQNGADDSRVKGATAPGEVDETNQSGSGKWGQLDSKSETRAKQKLGREFPGHYRQAVEQYFRKLARKRQQ